MEKVGLNITPKEFKQLSKWAENIYNIVVVIDYFVVIKNKLTKETLELTYLEFREKFVKEIYDVFKSYHKTQLNKYSYNLKDDSLVEFNFYIELHWNFNHFGNSNWYIERI